MYKFLVILCLFLVSCATVQEESKPPPQCLPTIAPVNLLSWPILSARTQFMPDETGTMHIVVFVEYKQNGHSVQVSWVDGLIAMVDTEPKNKEGSFWYDAGVLLETSTLIIQPVLKQTCNWKEYVIKKT